MDIACADRDDRWSLAHLFEDVAVWRLSLGREDDLDAARAKAGRLLLHAEYLAFAHPESGDPLNFTCPADF